MISLKIFKNRIFIAIVCVIVAFALAMVAFPIYNNALNQKVNVVVANQDIYPGTKITEDMLRIVEMSVDGVPSDAAHSIDEVMFSQVEQGVSLYATTTIMKDYYITSRQVAERLVSPQAKIRAKKANETVVSISLSNIELPGQLVPNNVVQVMYYDTDAQEYKEISNLRAISVVCTLTDDGTEITEVNQKNAAGEVLNPTRIQFILNREQSRTLASYAQSSKLAFFLVYAGDDPAQIERYLATNN